MKALLLAIIETVIRAIFRKSPEERADAKYEKALSTWQRELERLQDAETKAQNAYEQYVAHWHSTDATNGSGAVLHAQWSNACDALRRHRSGRPQRNAR